MTWMNNVKGKENVDEKERRSKNNEDMSIRKKKDKKKN